MSVATVATVRARTTSPRSRERVCAFCCRCDASVKYRVAVVLVAPCVKKQAAAAGPPLVSCLRASAEARYRRGTRNAVGRGPWGKRRAERVKLVVVANLRGADRIRCGAVSCVRAVGVGRHTVARCPRARPRRENNDVDLRAGNEREKEERAQHGR